MKKITSIEIKCLKAILKNYRDEVAELRAKNRELEKELADSRAKEGKGMFERMIESLSNAVASIDWHSIGNMMNSRLDEQLEIEEEGDDSDA